MCTGFVNGKEYGDGYGQPKREDENSGDNPFFAPAREPWESCPEDLGPLFPLHPDLLGPFEGIQDDAHSTFPLPSSKTALMIWT